MLDIKSIPLDDKAVYEMISQGHTEGIFQLCSAIGARVAKKVAPQNISDLSNIISLQRPGCLQGKENSIMEKFCRRKWGREKTEYLHDDLRPILSDTQGCMLFQEQATMIANKLAGLSLERADVLRHAIGKKIPEKMAQVKDEFMQGMENNKYEKEVAEKLWSEIEGFASYSFNRSHSVSYSIIAYQTAYLKYYYPVEFMCSLLTLSKHDIEPQQEVNKLVNECKRLGVLVSYPSLKIGNIDFSITGENKISFGLSHIKGVGDAAIAKLKKLGAAATFIDFLGQALQSSVNKIVVEALIMSGALDYYCLPRKHMMMHYTALRLFTPRESEMLWRIINDKKVSVIEACDILMTQEKFANKRRITTIKNEYQKLLAEYKEGSEFPLIILLGREKELLGITLSGSLVQCYGDKINQITHDIINLQTSFYGGKIKIGCVITAVKKVKTKTGEDMCFLSGSDASYKTEIVVFPKLYEKNKGLKEGDVILVSGQNNLESVVAQSIEKLNKEDGDESK
jgi:DNA polymerase-3 subunit alpha